MYILNIPLRVIELILSFLPFIQCSYIIRYTNTNIEPRWVETQLNIPPNTNTISSEWEERKKRKESCYTKMIQNKNIPQSKLYISINNYDDLG